MRKNIIIVLLILLGICLFAACDEEVDPLEIALQGIEEAAKETDLEAIATEEGPFFSPTDDSGSDDVAEASDAIGTYAVINCNGIDFCDEAQSFFDAFGDADTTFDHLQPLLGASISALCYGPLDVVYLGGSQYSADFVWDTLVFLILDYELDNNDGIREDNGTVIVDGSVMSDLAYNMFGFDSIPAIPETRSDTVSYDQETDSYRISMPITLGYSYCIDCLTLNNVDSSEGLTPSAIVTIDVTSESGDHVDTVNVELLKNAESSYHYSVQTIFMKD